MSVLTKRVFLSVLWRSFFLQASWNYGGMQNVGFSYSMAPVLKKLWRSTAERGEALRRHIRYFNTHPYLVNFILGGVIRLESGVAKGRVDPTEIDRWKASYMGSLGAIGDSLFWAGLHPLASLLALLIALREKTWAPCVMLLIFALARIGIQSRGLVRGFRFAEDLAQEIQRMRFTEWAARLKDGASFLAGAFLAMLGVNPELQLNPQSSLLAFLLFPLIVVLFSLSLKRGLNQWQLIGLLFAIFVVGAYSGEVFLSPTVP